ncbi:DUF3578 domain-containing protein [Aneurinibacillus thermoaerophilus]|nr:DUF3578 domain-containing protein [Aneurinibacillus sp. XH2]MED0674545.1 DUF3578 domain-containing protein [Aneurinibacillus thermoaerophilus]
MTSPPYQGKYSPFNVAYTFERVLKEYNLATNEPFKEHNLGNFIRHNMTEVIMKAANFDPTLYKITGSVGQGQWAEVPWVSIFRKSITTSATKGYYIVYLFQANMSGFYLSFNQGWTYFKNKYGTKEGRQKIRKTAAILRELLHTIPSEMIDGEINLCCRGELGLGYEAGHICGTHYTLEDLELKPEKLIRDLKSLQAVYNELELLIGHRSVEQFNDYLLLQDDSKFLEEEAQEEQYQETVASVAKKITQNTMELISEEEEAEKRPEPVTDKSGRSHWPRDATLSAKALLLANYKCAYDSDHTSFISKATRRPFMEAHHLVPMKLQGEFTYKLDKIANIISLCPTCHRMIHHGTDEDKEQILRKLFYERREKLESLGIEITFSQLKKAYYIELE